jgi:uncharacterized protein YndB with AHSA1/START domain
MTTMSEATVKIEGDVQLEISVDASPETIFPFLVDPALASSWMGTESENDPRPGGIYRNKLNAKVISRGEFLEVDPPRRVVFTFGWEGEDQHVPAGSTEVAIDLIPEGASTLVRLTHSGLPSEETKPDHAEGWSQYMSRLKVAAEGGDAGADPHGDPQT